MNINQLFEKFVGGGTAPDDTPNNQATTKNSGGGITDMLGQFTSGPAGGIVGGLAAGGLLGTLIGNKKMRKKAGKLAGGAVGYGGSAVLGAVALKAYQNWQSKGAAPTPASAQTNPTPQLASPESFDPALNTDAAGQPMQLTLIKSMIAAANADGHMDHKEQAAVFEAVGQMSLDGEAKALVFDMMRNPPTIEEIAGYATGMEQASEIYLASRLAIDPDQPSEQQYLSDLSKALGVPDELVREIELQLEPEKPASPQPKRMINQFGRNATEYGRSPL